MAKASALTVANRSPDDKATIDFETRSECDLLKCGGSVYSEHPTTEAMWLKYRLPSGAKGEWHMALLHHRIRESPPPQELFDWIADGGLVEAHNAFFERMIWKNVMVKRHGWPPVPHEQWRCSAAKTSSFALPRALGAACAALGLPVQKDDVGRRLMLKMCKPRKPRKADKDDFRARGIPYAEWPTLWHDDPEDFFRLGLYCETDVDSEHGLSLALRDLTPTELRLWQMDQEMNERGITCDLVMARAAFGLAEGEKTRLNGELEDLTDGQVERASQRARFKDWVNVNGVPLPDTQAPTLDEFVADPETPDLVRRALEIVKDVNRTSTAKYEAMTLMTSADGTLKDTFMYHGASTGRWAGKGVQPHNFVRGTVKAVTSDPDTAAAVISRGDREWIELVYGRGMTMEVLSSALRAALMAPEGKELMVADYAAIEARVVFWLADAQTALDVFRRGEDIYMDMATGIYGYRVHDKMAQADERQMGKQSILGLGFGMGFLTFLLTCRKYNITFTRAQVLKIVGNGFPDLERRVREYFEGDKRRARRLVDEGIDLEASMHEMVLMQYVVDQYRDRYPEVKQMWSDLEAGAIRAVKQRGTVVRTGKIEWKLTGRFLHARLPSGRLLSYCDPRVTQGKTPWGTVSEKLKFMGVDPYTKKWGLMETYGGMLCENVVQATARDLMAGAMLRLHDHPAYELVGSVHDEVVCQVADVYEGEREVEYPEPKKGYPPVDPSSRVSRRAAYQSCREFEAILSDKPAWAEGCPVEAEAWRGRRYRK